MADVIIDEIEYPGSFTLDEILNDLVVKESNRTEKLVKLEKLPDGPNGHRSLASLADRPIGVPFHRLLLVKVPEGKLASVKAAQIAKGKEFLFSATIWVENNETKVAAFR